MLGFFKARKAQKEKAARLYKVVQAQSRLPSFYARYGVPDTFDGRFELLLLHGFMVWHRLDSEGDEGKSLAQAFFDAMFVDINRVLREIGVGDLSVPRHAKRMMRAYHGRAMAYRDSLVDSGRLAEALRRNLFGTLPSADAAHIDYFSTYIYRSNAMLAQQAAQDILNGTLFFPSIAISTEQNNDTRVAA